MKLVYAVDKEGFNSVNRVGVRKKVNSMMRFFEKNGISASLCEYVWEKGFPTIDLEDDTDILYFRRLEPSIKLFMKLRQLKRGKRIRIVMEIPTYPFSWERNDSQSFLNKVSSWVGKRLIRYAIDRIVIVGSNANITKLYNIPVIHANNGVSFDDISISSKEHKNEQLDLIAVSSCFFWHGYDRLIKGMEEYYKSTFEKVVNFHIVGAGDCLDEYKELAKQAGLLDKHIFFYGKLEGKDLDDVYNKADVAVDCLACHRKNVFYVSALKVREYAAKGLPFVTANKVDVCNEDTQKFILELPADDTDIDVHRMLNFYEEMYKNYDNLNQLVRETFRPYCEWATAYSNVINYFNGN